MAKLREEYRATITQANDVAVRGTVQGLGGITI